MRNADPESVFRAANAALAAEDWSALVDLCDPVSIRLLAEQLRWPYLQPRPRRTLTAEEYLKHDPSLPAPVAEYYAARDKERAASDHLADDFPSISSVAELRSLEPQELVAAWLQSRSQRGQIEHQVSAGLITREVADRALSGLEEPLFYKVVGVVMDGECVSHIVYRYDGPVSTSENEAPSDPARAAFEADLSGKLHVSFITCRKTAGEWRIVAGHDMFGLGSLMYFVGEGEAEGNGV